MSSAPARAARLASLALGGALACASHRPAAGGAESVALRFAWPERLELGVTLVHRTFRDGAHATQALVRQRIVAEPRGGEIWVRVADSQGQGDDPDMDVNLRVAEALVQVVDREGRYLRAEGLDAALGILSERGEPPDAEKARRTLGRMLAEDWEASVGAWRGQRFELGALRRMRTEGSLPLLPGVAAPLEVEYGVTGRVPCREGEDEPRCVELAYRIAPAPGERAALIERVREAVPQGGPTVQEVSARSESILASDPATLVPYRLRVRQELRLQLRLPDGSAREATERSEDEYRFEPELAL